MKITLCEDNSFLFPDGRPTLVVLEVEKDGRVIRMPYEATKTLQEVYADAARIPDGEGEEVTKRIDTVPVYVPSAADKEPIFKDVLKDLRPDGKIQAGDKVQCVRLHPREAGDDFEFSVGGIYTVMKVMRSGGRVTGYEAIDEAAEAQMRYTLLPDEVVFHSKKPPSQKAHVFDMTHHCKDCGNLNALVLNDKSNRYEGTCERCGRSLTVERPKQQPQEKA